VRESLIVLLAQKYVDGQSNGKQAVADGSQPRAGSEADGDDDKEKKRMQEALSSASSRIDTCSLRLTHFAGGLQASFSKRPRT
jgi:hypothetical protein